MTKSKRISPQREQHSTFFSSLSPLKQDLLCIGFLYLITLILFRGIVFEDKTFSAGGDTANATAYAKVGNDIKNSEGVDPLWMPNFFSGMPTFGNVHYLPHDVSYAQRVVVTVLKFFYLDGTWSWFPVYYFFCGLFTFLLLRMWNLSRIAALLGALTFMLGPYGIGLASEGHGSKLMALSYLPLVFLLTHLLFERRDLLSFGLLAIGVGTLLLTNHLQIVYYVLIVIGLYLLYNIAKDFKENKKLIPVKASLFAGAVIIGICISSYVYLSVYEYAQYSIRGGGTPGAQGGLTWEYATNWSFHPLEMLTFIIPSFFGFSSSYVYNWQGQLTQLPLYWGTMPFNTSSVYFGIVPLLFGILSLVYKRNAKTIFFAILSVVILLLSFGKHFGIFYEIFFTILPFFNKFRAPAMVLHVITFTFAVLGAFGFDSVAGEMKNTINADKLKRGLLYALGAFGAILILLLLMKSSFLEMFGFTFSREGENYGADTARVLSELRKIRFELLWKDYIKFIMVFGASAAAIILYLNRTIKKGMFSVLILGILIADLVIIDSKYIDPKPQEQLEQNFAPDATINFLKQQEGIFRIFPLGDLYQENIFQYHGLQSMGGYSAAKLKIYQTMVDSALYHGPDPAFPINMNVVNMLNAKFIIANGQLPADKFTLANSDKAKKLLTYSNPAALPRALLVGKVVVARSESEVFRTLNSREFNPATAAILEKELPVSIAPPDSNASVSVTEYKSRQITLSAKTSTPSLLVLSEIYYPAGWKATIDGKETEIFKTNYALRSVVVPPGSHEVVFRFDPAMYSLGYTLSHIAWGIALLCVAIGLFRIPNVRQRFFGGKKVAEQPAA